MLFALVIMQITNGLANGHLFSVWNIKGEMK